MEVAENERENPAGALRPGELKIDKVGKFKLLPNPAVQDYVAGSGEASFLHISPTSLLMIRVGFLFSSTSF